jgi:hypothetical protein
MDSGRNVIMPKGSSRLSSVIESQKPAYLATLYNALYASEEPFDHFSKYSPVLLDISRKAFKSVWPAINIEVETDDALFRLVSLFTTINVEQSLSAIFRATSVYLSNEARFMTQ